MKHIEKIRSFLEAISYEQERRRDSGDEKMQNPFITISRETGAGGHSVASALLREMQAENSAVSSDWKICDQEICERVIQEPELRTSMRKLLSSEYHPQIEDMIEEMIFGDSPQDAVMKKMFAIIRTFAIFGNVILVGRAGACITRDLPNGIHIRLTASLPSRIKRVMSLHGVDEKHAWEFISLQDKGRKNLVKTFFNRNIADPLLYDMIFNTDRVPAEDIAHLVTTMLNRKSGFAGKESR